MDSDLFDEDHELFRASYEDLWIDTWSRTCRFGMPTG